jgi:hypothetical protein
LDVGLVALAHGPPTVQNRFRAHAAKLGLSDRILQIPFLPHWRVPEFLRGCLAVCCLEQGFPIEFHAPMIPREVLLSGTCLVSSTELIRKLRSFERLPHGCGCIAIEDVNDVDALREALVLIVRNPRAGMAIGMRGRRFALELQRDIPFPQILERRSKPPPRGRKSRAGPAALRSVPPRALRRAAFRSRNSSQTRSASRSGTEMKTNPRFRHNERSISSPQDGCWTPPNGESPMVAQIPKRWPRPFGSKLPSRRRRTKANGPISR